MSQKLFAQEHRQIAMNNIMLWQEGLTTDTELTVALEQMQIRGTHITLTVSTEDGPVDEEHFVGYDYCYQQHIDSRSVAQIDEAISRLMQGDEQGMNPEEQTRFMGAYIRQEIK